MTVLETAREKLTTLARTQQQRYSGGEDRPLGGYAMTMATYGMVVGAIAGVARLSGRDIPDALPVKDVALGALATEKLSRMLAKDPVTSPLRAPFASYEGTEGPAELSEEVRGTGLRKTVGELITCPFCTSVWVATGLTAGMIYLPRTTRLAVGTLAVMAGADVMQFAHAWLQKVSS